MYGTYGLGCGYPTTGGWGCGYGYALVLVLFILLVIIGSAAVGRF
ncbi:MAG: YjcZ family sporulation protein [Bacilli bacterium]|jgi:uncharacterized protein (TIGR01732 family)|nr:YjcZ family sporulation protein [Bacillota bacterium]NLM31378.1 YjcZ family sporulation protein [Acholeplasmataceae bacterium]HOA78216.1 YjcZ family sporulation protein [Bacilli bacterium]HPZ26514.1 YjcZ family sporulation protein [Bacilli bacterium]HQC88988.1 YjcZ family sporulation protein [Bacilli bacterium]